MSAGRARSRLAKGFAGFLLATAGLAAWVLWVNRPGPLPESPSSSGAATLKEALPALRARGAYLTRVGNCAGCHTAPGGAAMAGGRAITTPFGTVFSTNLTPDPSTGIGGWSPDDFWRALHEGRSRDGRLLSPAFPYTSYTLLTRADTDAILAHLQSQTAVAQPARAPEMQWPYGSGWAVAIWRALYFRPASFEPQPRQDAAWNRGAYLAEGLAHCNACHGSRNRLGAPQSPDRFDGSLLQGLGWHAPSLHRPDEAGMQAWSQADAEAWLHEGASAQGIAQGPMVEVVLGSTRHLNPDDTAALAHYLRALPPEPAPASPDRPAAPRSGLLGARLYETHCQNCHGASGEGRPGAYPALKGSRVVQQDSPVNLLRIIQQGGFAPDSAAHPRPYGMPPFAGAFDAEEMAALMTHLRTGWGQAGSAVSAQQVQAMTNGMGTNP